MTQFYVVSQGQQENYSDQKIHIKKLDNSKWNSLKKELDYKKQGKDVEKKSSRSFSLPFSISSLAVKIFLFIAAIVALIFILYRLFDRPTVNNTQIEKVDYTIENFDEDIHEANLDDFLKTSLANKNHKQVIRIYYLMILKELSNKKIIHWKKDKTNYQYLMEMKFHKDFTIFKDLTLYFEYIWYSQRPFTEEQYSSISLQFKKFLESLYSNKTSTVYN